jgi:CheY-like chemotaxis protein
MEDLTMDAGRKILIVDDDPTMRSAVSKMLSWLGYHVSSRYRYESAGKHDRFSQEHHLIKVRYQEKISLKT